MERFFMPGRDPFRLEPRDPVLYYLQRLRDESHRFAIGSHRARRKTAISSNPLDEIAGIGPTRKRALLLHFGSAKAVKRAGARGSGSYAGDQCPAGPADLRSLPRKQLNLNAFGYLAPERDSVAA
jgi:hypothetical protein